MHVLHSSLPNRFGVETEYPTWMGFSPKHYLFDTQDECCTRWYPNDGDCMKEASQIYFPSWKDNGCTQGDGYPTWMSEPTLKQTHLFKTASECCDYWFPSESAACQANVGKQVGGDPNYKVVTWYPALNGTLECINDEPPSWMNQNGYKTKYLFESQAACCGVFHCTGA